MPADNESQDATGASCFAAATAYQPGAVENTFFQPGFRESQEFQPGAVAVQGDIEE
jgi:hypothetical protein